MTKTKTQRKRLKFELNKYNCQKWMRYEEDISKYYYPMILDWIRSNPRKGSSTAFTSGLGRNIAYLIEVALEQQRKMTKSEDYMVSDQKRQEEMA